MCVSSVYFCCANEQSIEKAKSSCFQKHYGSISHRIAHILIDCQKLCSNECVFFPNPSVCLRLISLLRPASTIRTRVLDRENGPFSFHRRERSGRKIRMKEGGPHLEKKEDKAFLLLLKSRCCDIGPGTTSTKNGPFTRSYIPIFSS